MLNGLAGLVKSDSEQPLEVEEARSGAFLVICEVGKALDRGQPADRQSTSLGLSILKALFAVNGRSIDVGKQPALSLG